MTAGAPLVTSTLEAQAAVEATPAASAVGAPIGRLQWMAQSDWQVVVTRRELEAEQIAERRQAKQDTPKTSPKLEWMSSNRYGSCVKRRHSDDRAAAAGFHGDWSWKAVRWAERKKEEPELLLDEARRKRVMRIEEGNEDRDAMRELARSHNDGTQLELESTPDGLRETAMDGTPRSAKAAGAELRKLTQSFYQRLMDPRFYALSLADMEAVNVPSDFWDKSVPFHQGWAHGTRPLKVFKCKRKPVVTYRRLDTLRGIHKTFVDGVGYVYPAVAGSGVCAVGSGAESTDDSTEQT